MKSRDANSESASKPEKGGGAERDMNSLSHAIARRAGCVALLGCMFCGCSLLKEQLPLRNEPDQTSAVQKILTMWAFSSQEEPDGSNRLGFAGKVLFFRAGSDTPIKVAGKIEVQIYEQQGDQWRLRRKFISEQDAWERNERQTALGTVYDVFVPHDTVMNQKYSLVLKFHSLTGHTASSPHAQLP